MSYKVAIIDDEPLAVKVIKNYVEQIKELQLVTTFTNAVDASSFFQKEEVDIVFLDINMPVMSGLDLLSTINSNAMVVITTAHENYALESYELQAIDYLVKPIPFPRFLKAVNRIISLKEGAKKLESPSAVENPSIFVKVDKKKLQKVYLDDITVIESLKDYIRIKTKTNQHIVHSTLTSFTEELPQEKFLRIHRSYTIAIDKIDAIEGNSIEIGGTRYTIGRSYINEVKSKILQDSFN
ncbi:LytR/AlgR family response regulator transcription factor [Arenibacter certesii]|uniref:DNA-binding response regulator n=1 Tax=Arenibacter certesii TaxID=228955 RepID=A0A918MIF0_9FLAO|nr:LytTR family DNA-binding domain-containing protein [Arenibacter certesii]GGW27565.1 DNA-binding response regulator [Arenibacter certesii]